MNTRVILPVVTLCATACCGQSNVVYYGTNSNALDVVFVDTNLSAKAQSAIVVDLNLCLSEWGKTSQLRLRDKGDSVGYLDIGTRCPHYPRDIEFPRNIVSNGTAGVALQIPQELSDAYTNAFVAFVSSTNFPNVPPKKFPDYYLDNHRTTSEIIEDAQEIISELGHQTYYPPSVLGFMRLSAGPKEIFSNSNLWVRIPCTDSSGDEKDWGPFPAMWHKGKWKFCFWPEK